MKKNDQSIITNVVKYSLNSNIAILLLIVSFVLGINTIIISPKEEDPQISVPIADVIVDVPGATAKEVKKLVSTPLEQLLWQIKGVEDVYSVSRDGKAIATVKFFVNTNEEQALIRLRNQIEMNIDRVPSIVNKWIVKPITINDVPIVNIVLHSQKYTDFVLQRIAQEVSNHLSKLPNISKTYITNGRLLRLRVQLDVSRLAGFGITAEEVEQVIKDADFSVIAGHIDRFNKKLTVSSHSFLKKPIELKNLVIGVKQDRPVYLRDVATIIYGPNEAENYSFFYNADHKNDYSKASYHAVTIGLAKKEGTNAVVVSNEIKRAMKTLAPTLLPHDVEYSITRDYGDTAQNKVNDLLKSLALAIITVLLVLWFFLGWREAFIVAISVPLSFSLALFCNYLFGYSINRVTLFALILSLGIVVDDPITNVENIKRHLSTLKGSIENTICYAVNEVLPPVIMATLTIIVAFVPMFYITGMMGPYMAPMASTVPLAVVFSTVSALVAVPWLSKKLLTKQATENKSDDKESRASKFHIFYTRLISPFLNRRRNRYLLSAFILLLMIFAMVLVIVQKVPVKLLPFDNKNELQLVIDLPEGTTLESSLKTTQAFSNFLKKSPYVSHFTTYIGTNSPMDFNGMVRRYYLRQHSNHVDIRINLFDKKSRQYDSHEVGLTLRKQLEQIANKHQAKLSIVEMPPGPPVLQTIVAEISGQPGTNYAELIDYSKKLETILKKQPYVVDIDSSSETPIEKIDFIIDKEKAAMSGISTDQIAKTLVLALGKVTQMTLHKENERLPLSIEIELPKYKRSNISNLYQIKLKDRDDNLIPLISLGKFKLVDESQPIYSKNLNNVVYVVANTAGRPPIDVIYRVNQILKADPFSSRVSVNWSSEGEFKITKRVFRDMGLGYLAALFGIYILLLMQTNSFFLPLLMMLSIPLTIIGIMPGFWLLNLIANHPINGYPNPIYFTATSMIGMIALGGIVIRNSVILIDFIQKKVAEGIPLKEAVLVSGSVRARPIFLTATTTAISAWPITLDPIFSGLAWALIFGITASTLFTLIVIPVSYYSFYNDTK